MGLLYEDGLFEMTLKPRAPSLKAHCKALYRFMPAVAESCACSVDEAGAITGCDGGNTDVLWNNWMRKMTHSRWSMADSCKPYIYKCWSSDPGSVVNPLSAKSCPLYSQYSLWTKPCACIPRSSWPKSMLCPTTAPPAECAIPIPPAFFLISNMAAGLSNQDAVLNMQRHILEFGPIYVSMDVTDRFLDWDWETHPIYTGGENIKGGHAVTAVGWGSTEKDYWIIRNSWGSGWADAGYCRFHRGVNLDNIEASEAAAAMPTKDFADWSAPYCELQRFYRRHLASYTVDLTYRCNKDANLTVFASVPLESRDDIFVGVEGETYASYVLARQAAVVTIDVFQLGFGTRTADMWVRTTAADTSGNSFDTSHFLALPAITS